MSGAFCYSESIRQLYELPAWHFALHLALGEYDGSSGTGGPPERGQKQGAVIWGQVFGNIYLL